MRLISAQKRLKKTPLSTFDLMSVASWEKPRQTKTLARELRRERKRGDRSKQYLEATGEGHKKPEEEENGRGAVDPVVLACVEDTGNEDCGHRGSHRENLVRVLALLLHQSQHKISEVDSKERHRYDLSTAENERHGINEKR